MLKLFTQGGTAGAILILALVIASGLYLGRFKLKGISLGTTWILFMGILLGHFGLRVNPTMLSFVKDFGLILFVFAIDSYSRMRYNKYITDHKEKRRFS